MSERILVGLATYNERENLAGLIAEIHRYLPAADVLVTDDGSPDGTGVLADQLAAADPRVRVIHRPGKLGLGTAILGAMRYAIENGYDYYINMDADFSHQPKYLPDLLRGMERYDVMIGSRYVPGGGVENWPPLRQFSSRAVNWLTRFLFRLPARDCSGSFRCYRVARLRQIDPAAVISRGYSFQQEILLLCRRARCRIGETPIIFPDRRAGRSKVNWKEMCRSLATIFRLGLGLP